MTHFDPPTELEPPGPLPPGRRFLKEPSDDIFATSEFYNSLIQIVIVAAAAVALIFALLP